MKCCICATASSTGYIALACSCIVKIKNAKPLPLPRLPNICKDMPTARCKNCSRTCDVSMSGTVTESRTCYSHPQHLLSALNRAESMQRQKREAPQGGSASGARGTLPAAAAPLMPNIASAQLNPVGRGVPPGT